MHIRYRAKLGQALVGELMMRDDKRHSVYIHLIFM